MVAVSFLAAGKILANRGVELNQNASDKAVEAVEKEKKQSESNADKQKESKKPEELKPEFKFDLKERTIKEGFEVKGEVDSAQKVEFYLIKEGSTSPKIYLGKAKGDKDEWEAEFDSSNIPNGKYDLYAEIKNVYGTYVSDPEKIEIENLEEETDDEEKSGSEKGGAEQLNSSNGQEVASENRNVDNNRDLSNQPAQNQDSEKKESQSEKDDSKNDSSKEGAGKEKDNENSDRGLDRAEEATKKKDGLTDQETSNFIQEVEKRFSKDGKDLTKEEKKEINQIKEQLKKDSDGDGLPDHEEKRLGTDPYSADTDGDGYLDGDEVKNGFDPLGYSSGNKEDKIVFEDPREKGQENRLYKVERAEMEEEIESGQESEERIKIEGSALPNSFVTLYIYSDPVVVSIKADKDGSWSYILDKELEDGEHEAYAAVTDNTGKVTYKSKPFDFVKTAKAITSPAQAAENPEQQQAVKSPVEKGQEKLVAFVLLISFSALILALISIVLLFKQHKENSKE